MVLDPEFVVLVVVKRLVGIRIVVVVVVDWAFVVGHLVEQVEAVDQKFVVIVVDVDVVEEEVALLKKSLIEFCRPGRLNIAYCLCTADEATEAFAVGTHGMDKETEAVPVH